MRTRFWAPETEGTNWRRTNTTESNAHVKHQSWWGSPSRGRGNGRGVRPAGRVAGCANCKVAVCLRADEGCGAQVNGVTGSELHRAGVFPAIAGAVDEWRVRCQRGHQVTGAVPARLLGDLGLCGSRGLDLGGGRGRSRGLGGVWGMRAPCRSDANLARHLGSGGLCRRGGLGGSRGLRRSPRLQPARCGACAARAAPLSLCAFGGVRGSGCGAAPPFANVKVPTCCDPLHGMPCPDQDRVLLKGAQKWELRGR
jgi:hypothetical protein